MRCDLKLDKQLTVYKETDILMEQSHLNST